MCCIIILIGKKIIENKNKEHLKELILAEMDIYGNKCALNHLDVSNVKDMSYIFYSSEFNGYLNNWLPYKREDKEEMFKGCSAPTPYWYNAENTQKAIESYQLKNKLEKHLVDINKSVKKIII